MKNGNPVNSGPPVPELLAPAGDMEKLTMAVHYGADAVYLAGQEFGMRAAAANFTPEQMEQAVAFCHARGVRVYVTCNTIPREEELPRLPAFLEHLQRIGADGVIAADLGVAAAVRRRAPELKLHVSTQLGVLNSATANFLYDLGADTVVLARETPLEDIRKIRRNTPPELRLEAFVHGAMCVSFSGRCLLSNYLTGRDANRGQCAQPCRWKYHLVEETRPGETFEITEDGGTFILNSRDMCMIRHVRELMEAGVDSFKIEGRMKSAYYAAVVTNAYRHVMDDILAGREPDPVWIAETEKISHRPYSTGFYFGPPGQHYGTSSYINTCDVVAVVEQCGPDGMALLTQRNKFSVGDRLELLTPHAPPVTFVPSALYTEEDQPLSDTRHAMQRFRMQLPFPAEQYAIVRRDKIV